jgi:hypothetical protein
MKSRLSVYLASPQPMLVGWLFVCTFLSGCAPGVRYATEAESAATGIVLLARHVTGRPGGELTLRNAGTRPCFITNPYHCSVYLTLLNAQGQPLMPNRKVKRFCDPAENVPRLLPPGDSIRYALENPRWNHDEEELRKARFFEVVYQGIISPQTWNVRQGHRPTTYTLKTSGAID